MALMSLESDMQNVPVIQRTARFCIFFSSLMFFKVGALLKNQSWNLYKVIGKTQVLYSSLFWMGSRPLEKFSNIFMALRVDIHFVV